MRDDTDNKQSRCNLEAVEGKIDTLQKKGGLRLMKSSNETLQNLPYYIHMKTQSCFFRFSCLATLFFPLINALVYVSIDH